jgi:hypothetical protein
MKVEGLVGAPGKGTVATIKIGWTKRSDFWTYQPEAERHFIEFELFLRDDTDPERVAEAAFEATNSPGSMSPLAQRILWKIGAFGYRGEEAGHYSLSVGDTVQVDEVLLACERFGWKEVEAAPVELPEEIHAAAMAAKYPEVYGR